MISGLDVFSVKRRGSYLFVGEQSYVERVSTLAAPGDVAEVTHLLHYVRSVLMLKGSDAGRLVVRPRNV